MLEAATGGAERANVYDIYRGESMEPATSSSRRRPSRQTASASAARLNHSLIIQINDASTGETYISIQRPGWGPGKRCLGACPACADMCRDGVIIHDGLVTAEPTMPTSAPAAATAAARRWRTRTPSPRRRCRTSAAAASTSTVHVFENHDSDAPNGVVTGPKIFGGCTRAVPRVQVRVATMDGRDIGRVRKLVPQSCGQVCQELCTDSDRYRISLYEAASGEERRT